MFDRTPYTPGMREVIYYSRNEALLRGELEIQPEHYMLGLLRKGDGLGIQVLLNLGFDPTTLRREIERQTKPPMLEKRPLFTRIRMFMSDGPPHSPETKDVFQCMKEIATELRHNWHGTEHLLLALVKHANNLPARHLAQHNVTYPIAKEQVLKVIDGTDLL